MTIGSSYNYPAHVAKDARKKRSPHIPWAGRFPNPPDLCFDYRALVEQKNGIAKATDPHHKICIIGAGVTGLTAARELHRCGFTRITLIEQSTRVGGRHLTVPGSRNSEASHTPFDQPRYIGLAALNECLLFLKPAETEKSLYDHCLERPKGLLTDSSVTRITKLGNQQTRVYYNWKHSQPKHAQEHYEDFDSVILTLPSWLIETRIKLENFTPQMLPFETIHAYKTAHWETSCKVFAPLKKSFLSGNSKIPQAIVTDSFIHDVYTYRYNDQYSYDCILLSYTWEDDATKLATFSDKELVTRCANELDRILLKSTNIQQRISPYIGLEQAVVQRWITDKNALGCAKLYRPGAYYDAVSLMKYNRDFAHVSGLYLSGESFSVDAGWTEPCFRGAVDAVIHICNKTAATFNGGFSMADYPHYAVAT